MAQQASLTHPEIIDRVRDVGELKRAIHVTESNLRLLKRVAAAAEGANQQTKQESK